MSVVDVVSKEVRSRMMAGIRGANTRPEIQVRKYLHSQGLRFRLHGSRLPARPDIVLPRWSVAVLVHGCFWHGHDSCRYFRLPTTRQEFWREKIRANIYRDRKNVDELMRLGWRVAIIWECALREDAQSSLAHLDKFIRSGEEFVEIQTGN